ncbi:hypothetical protein EOI86_11260 [Hwanghaeella grinnelliae]|uniref:Alpha/beta hydrolase n=1 Tax=Hwanghaeella grinnelliae TaxID=2500179 RepID=A0A437QMS5_9PROT|nr:hypothetical protein [Hwanghaeella grinnelliae]RVU35836.1 hypothetical protein EOI86_11260 [Hwanghaeella grinnelliae]
MLNPVERSLVSFISRPWFDRVATPAISRLFFPLSAAWAAAVVAGGDQDRFVANLNDGPGRRSVPTGLLRMTVKAADRYADALAHWEDGLFGPVDGADDTLVRLERARLRHSRAFMGLRAAFLPGHLERSFPAARFAIEDEEVVSVRHRARLADPIGGFLPELDTPVSESRAVAVGETVFRWLRFTPPIGAKDLLPAEARVLERTDKPPRATVLFLHGIGMETEQWGEHPAIANWVLDQGFRVVEPHGPWHTRRALPGRYGGEPILARGVGGLLDYSWTHVREVGRLIAWARQRDIAAGRDPGPVLLVGTSLGALTTMQLLSWSGNWPKEARPDSALLIAPAASLADVAFRGSLTGQMGVPKKLNEAGWTEETVAHWARLLDAADSPCIPPDRICAALGTMDEITPFNSGRELIRRWNIPAGNWWVREQGHFSVGLGITAEPTPLHQAVSITLAAAGR